MGCHYWERVCSQPPLGQNWKLIAVPMARVWLPTLGQHCWLDTGPIFISVLVPVCCVPVLMQHHASKACWLGNFLFYFFQFYDCVSIILISEFGWYYVIKFLLFLFTTTFLARICFSIWWKFQFWVMHWQTCCLLFVH